ncbi:hypothetical protein F511_17553 [Dorcoceras hygrometricum]|uniref:Uncharacterized protein n=1 Tax=Dorcoceras hygrometricum TaxID=472368 RepID=A0A2Z7BD08_9LAMI|nr:hypothetical protein F511_17553 [Dorcoceras hygrometricum]
MAPSAPRTHAAAALRMKQISLDNQSRIIRRLRAQLATERRGLATMKKELEDTQVALEASHKVIELPDDIGLSMSKKIEKMKVKKQQVRANHVEWSEKFQARIHEAEDLMQAQHLIIKALVDEKDSLLQTIHGLQEANNAPAPFDGPLMADARLPHLCAYKYQRTTTEFLTPFRNSQSEKQHFFATKCCGNSSRFLAKVLCKRRSSREFCCQIFHPAQLRSSVCET